MPIIYRNEYGVVSNPNGGHIEITPTVRAFVEEDGTDVRFDRVRVFNIGGVLVSSYLRDKMGRRFTDNLPNTEDDLAYLETLPLME